MLSLAGINLAEKYKLLPFDEKQSKKEISKTIVYNKLYEARKKTKKNWLFHFVYPGKTKIFDGRTGIPSTQPILVGYAYILKLMHLVKDKLNARLIGPYSAISKQPIRGKSRNGGQRFGEMEIWALEGFGAAYLLHEIITIKSDDLTTRSKALTSLTIGTSIPEPDCPETLKILIMEIQSLGLELNIFSKIRKTF
jgi:DNA-directed RNA polymerase subunit beta